MEDGKAGVGLEACGLQQRSELRAGPFADGAPAFDAIMPGDLGARWQRANVGKRQRLRAVDQAVDLEPPVRKARLDHGVVFWRVRIARAVRLEDTGNVALREFAGER